MKEQFIPRHQAIKLKKLGFDEPCLAYYIRDSLHVYETNLWFEGKSASKLTVRNSLITDIHRDVYQITVTAPLWQQAFDWFEDTHGLFSEQDNLLLEYCFCSEQNGHITIIKGYDLLGQYSNRYEVRVARLNHLIKIAHERLGYGER